jgi:GNAT superfamily N-acetyltransferase
MNHPVNRATRVRITSPLNYNYVAGLLARFPRDIRMRDGSKLRLRELRSSDREMLKAFFESCSPEAIRYRFMAPLRSLPDGLLDSLANADGSRQVALILTKGAGNDEMIVAEGRYVMFEDRPGVADVAFLVADDFRRRGIATLLIEELMEIASRNGVKQFSVDVLGDNWAMLALLRKLGLSGSGRVSQGVVRFEIPVAFGKERAMPEVA